MTFSRTSGVAPASAKTSFPAVATGLPPKTGAQRNEALCAESWDEIEVMVWGWTVEQSMKIFWCREIPDSMVELIRDLRTESLDTFFCCVRYINT